MQNYVSGHTLLQVTAVLLHFAAMLYPLCVPCLQDVRQRFHRVNNRAQMERLWTQAYNNGTEQRLRPLQLITGTVLPLLKTISRVVEQYRGADQRIRCLQVSRVLSRFVCLALGPNCPSTTVCVTSCSPARNIWRAWGYLACLSANLAAVELLL